MLDVVIGLVFMFLLLSLLATIVQEMLAGWLSLRGRRLERAIRNLLSPHFKDRNPRLIEIIIRKATSQLFSLLTIDYFNKNWTDRRDKVKELKAAIKNDLESAGSSISEEKVKEVFRVRLFDSKYLNKKQGDTICLDQAAKHIVESLQKPKDDKELDRILNRLFLADLFFESPLYRQLIGTDKNRQPSYLSGDRFVSILLQVIVKERSVLSKSKGVDDKKDNNITLEKVISAVNDLPEGELKENLQFFISQSKGDLAKLRLEVSRWYDELMDRVSGWYKRYLQGFTFAIGFVLALVFNANTFEVYKKLSIDPEARAAIVEQATAFVNENPNLIDSMKAKGYVSEDQADSLKVRLSLLRTKTDTLIVESLDDFSNTIGMGWKAGLFNRRCKNGKNFWGNPKSVSEEDCVECESSFWKTISQGFWGWLVTALAISLGAPFWFDMLRKLINIRNAGKVAQSVIRNGKLVELKEGQEVRDKAVG